MKIITHLLRSYGNNEIDKRNIALTRSFILEQFTSFKRYILAKEFFPTGHTVIYVRPILWLLASSFVILTMFFFLYWTLNWGVKNGGTTLHAWGMNFLISFIQSLIWLQIVEFYINYLVLRLAIRPQLMAIKRILHQSAVNYIQNEHNDVKSDIQVLSSLSPACRVARNNNKYCNNSFGAIVLRNINDRDIIRCQTEGK